MSNPPPAQSMSRRERRLVEQQSLQAQAVGLPAPQQPLVNPVLPPQALYSLPSTNPLPPAYAPPPVVSPPTPPPVQTPQRPLSRRELRQAQEASQSGYSLPPTPPPLYSLDPTQISAPPPPLPPVFGSAPMTQPQPMTLPLSQPAPPPVHYGAPSSVSPETYPVAQQVPFRTVGDSPLTTSSLILPTTPTIDLTSPLGSTGEVVATGQILLPSRIAETGTSPRLENRADNDEVMDAYVTGETAAMSKPMRASQAVSGKGDDTDILLVRRARMGKAAVVTALTAASLGLVAAGLLVLAMLTNVVE